MSDSQKPPKKIGYKSPPEHSKWKKGQSGNPSGKRKKELSVQELVQKLAGEEITVQKNGLPLSMPRIEAVLMAILGKALKADLPSAKFVVDQYGVDPHEAIGATTARSIEIDEKAVAVLRTHTDWVAIVEEAKAKLAEKDSS